MIYKTRNNNFQKVMVFIVSILIILACFMNFLTSGIVSIVIGILLIYIILHEYYAIENHTLVIKKGFETNKINILNIDLLNIIHIRNMTYIEIVSKNKKIVVKPVETNQFIKHLISINPYIHVQNLNKSTKQVVKPVMNESVQ
ncbi:PH domain-containing protein [Macrococcoides bohemicum]|uniref:PH domain-containing protein n=1 Tax=Macrococcoides bohemicum TaxID=1903056 RepID=UPI0028AFAED3|nr:PH domain-containing protein [Macrococcus bohemicus]